MPDKEDQATMERAMRDKAEGKSASTQAGEFVREEVHHVREGKHGARSAKQAIAIGLSKARRAGVDLPPPKRGKVTAKSRSSAQRAYAVGHGAPPKRAPSKKRSQAIQHALEQEGHETVSHKAMSKQAKSAARNRTAADRSRAAKQASATKGPQGRHTAAMKAVRTKGHKRMSQAAHKAARTRAAHA
jgi:hypothetical protein